MTVRSARMWVAVLAAVGMATPAAGQDASPLVLDGATSLSLGPTRACDLARVGTIEIWAAALWTDDPGYPPALIACRKPARNEAALPHSVAYSVHLRGDRRALLLYDGESWEQVDADFSDGQYHSIALITKGAITEVIVDGVAKDKARFGYGKGKGLPLHVGSADGASDPFIGAIWSLRLWSAPLTKTALAELSETAGPPEESNPFASKLLAYSDFTTEATRVVVPGEEAEAQAQPVVDAMAEAEVVELEASEETQDEPWGVWVVRDSRVFEKQQVPDVDDTKHFRYRDYPLWRLERSSSVERALASRAAGADGGRDFTDEAPAGSRIAKVEVVSEDARIHAVRVTAAREDGRPLQLPRHGTSTSGNREIFELEEGEQVIGVSGSHDAEALTSLRIHTDRRASPLFGAEQGETFALRLPDGIHASGFHGREGRSVNAIGLAYSGQADGILMVGTDGSRRSFLPEGGGRYRSGKSELVLDSNNQFRLDDVVYERVPPHEVNEEKEKYNDLFAVANQLYNVEYSFRSYDIARLDPWDFKQNGAKRRVIEFPGEGSTAWTVQNRSMVPNGVMYVTVNQGGADIRTSTHSNESSYQQALTASLSLGELASQIPYMSKAFQWDETYTQTIDEMYNEEKTFTQGEALIAVYSLIFDPARAALDPTFVKRVDELTRTGDYEDFIGAYGTHYPYAVTYGGKGLQQMEMSSSTYSKLAGQNVDIQQSAIGTLLSNLSSGRAPTSLGDFASTTTNVDDRFQKAMSEERNTFRWIGGQGGFSAESWNVMENLTPIYLDLRPLDELLRAPFFTDEKIIEETRKGLQKAIAKYLDGVPSPRTKDVRPALFEVTVTALEGVKSGELDRTLELYGEIEVTAQAGRDRIPPAGEAGPVWKRDAKHPTAVKDGTRVDLRIGALPGENSRVVFAVREEQLDSGAFAQISAHLAEHDGDGEAALGSSAGDEELGKEKSPKLTFRNAEVGEVKEGSLRFRESRCGGSCAEVKVHYRWTRMP